MNIYQKIVDIRKTIDVFVKDQKGYNYDYVSGSQVLGKIKSKMDELGVVLEQHLINHSYVKHEYKDKYNKDKIDFIVTGEMKMIWVNADDPADRAVVSWQMLGQQDEISKALGSGLTYAERYFLLKYFGVPTDKDDPDAKPKGDDPKPKQEQPKQEQPKQNPEVITEAQAKRLFAISKGKNEIVKEVVSKFGYSSSKEIKKKDYESICKEIETKVAA